jgi:uncharacterized protein (UPF0332 family)
MSRKENAIQLKLQHANLALKESEVLLQNNFNDGAVSRMYYACFHATLALLLTKDLTPKTHKGAATELHMHFVLEGNFDKKYANFYRDLMQQRTDSDYGDYLSMTKEKAEQLMISSKEYIDYITFLLTSP